MKTIAVLGEGAWGTAIATVLAHNGFAVNLWCYDQSVQADIEKNRSNSRYLPGVTLAPTIRATTSFTEALNPLTISFIFQAVPVKFLRSVIEQAKPYTTENQQWISLSKGIEQNTLMLPSDIINTVLGYTACKAVIAGPSFAFELARKQITAFNIATTNSSLAEELKFIISNEYVCASCSSDLIGTQLTGALKNIIALATGMLEGTGYHENTRAFILTCALHEISLLIKAFGANPRTAYGLSGVGDVILTAFGTLSKNRALGYQLGQGKIKAPFSATTSTPEGINTLHSLHQWLLDHHELQVPFFKGMYRVIFNGESLANLLQEIMSSYTCYEQYK